jgi:hypothetical protein
MSWRFGIEKPPVFFQKRWQLRRVEIYYPPDVRLATPGLLAQIVNPFSA